MATALKLATVDRWGASCTFECRITKTGFEWCFDVATVPEPADGEFFQLRVETRADNCGHVTFLGNSERDEYSAKGIPDALLPFAATTIHARVYSSPRWSATDIYRSDRAEKMWRRLRVKGIAHYALGKGLYYCDPSPAPGGAGPVRVPEACAGMVGLQRECDHGYWNDEKDLVFAGTADSFVGLCRQSGAELNGAWWRFLQSNDTVGFGWLVEDASDPLMLEVEAVIAPQFRCAGIGRPILDCLLADARLETARQVRGVVRRENQFRRAALALLLHCGFELEGNLDKTKRTVDDLVKDEYDHSLVLTLR